MNWVLGEPPSAAVRERLVETGVLPESIDALELREVMDPLPAWWKEQRNALFLAHGASLPARLIEAMTVFPFADALLVIGSSQEPLVSLLVGGDRATVFLGTEVVLMWGEIYCGGASAVVLNGKTVGTGRAMVDARNGGAVIAAPDQLWAGGVYIATDDMHRLEDAATGLRLNPFGARIELGEHVWIARDAIVTGNTTIGRDSVVATRSIVRSMTVPPQTAVAGTPARVIREGITWRGEDTP